ncbi:hypothetical protein CRG98_017670 [Punica granatum]|uniref:Glycolipid transfer protein domain-containing protein n=1 Tax=Punica granatum TaxID=22663 RepID=A0A2I0K053_PUNGR|nr:hypothetical protein CRG98_017670 [Punica granatum]
MDGDLERQLRTTIKEAARLTATTPLSGVVEAFEGLALFVRSHRGKELRLDTFCDACSLVSVLFNCLGLAFKFAEMEYVAKVRDLMEASKIYTTLYNVLDRDVANRTGLDLIRALFEQFLSSNDYSLKNAATTAYSRVCAPYHTWAVRTAVYAGMYTLPSREQLLLKLHETDQTAGKKMRRYMNAVAPVIEYIDKLYMSRNISLDW